MYFAPRLISVPLLIGKEQNNRATLWQAQTKMYTLHTHEASKLKYFALFLFSGQFAFSLSFKATRPKPSPPKWPWNEKTTTKKQPPKPPENIPPKQQQQQPTTITTNWTRNENCFNGNTGKLSERRDEACLLWVFLFDQMLFSMKCKWTQDVRVDGPHKIDYWFFALFQTLTMRMIAA